MWLEVLRSLSDIDLDDEHGSSQSQSSQSGHHSVEALQQRSLSAIIASDRDEDGKSEGHADGANELVMAPWPLTCTGRQSSSQDESNAPFFGVEDRGFIDLHQHTSSAEVMSSLVLCDSFSLMMDDDSLPMVLPSLHEDWHWTVPLYQGLIESEAGDKLTCSALLSLPDVSDESPQRYSQPSDDAFAPHAITAPHYCPPFYSGFIGDNDMNGSDVADIQSFSSLGMNEVTEETTVPGMAEGHIPMEFQVALSADVFAGSSLNDASLGVQSFPTEYETMSGTGGLYVPLDPFHRHSDFLDLPIPTEIDEYQEFFFPFGAWSSYGMGVSFTSGQFK
jgi:hypothetical protein